MDDLIKEMSGRKWGKWWLDSVRPPSLNFPLPYETYWMALDRLRTVNQRRLFIEHMTEKRYISKRDLVDLRRAFNDLAAAGVLSNEELLRE